MSDDETTDEAETEAEENARLAYETSTQMQELYQALHEREEGEYEPVTVEWRDEYSEPDTDSETDASKESEPDTDTDEE